MDKTVQVRDLVIGEGRPKICIPVMGSTTETLKEAAGHAMKKHPDLIEWRADYFADIENEEVRRQAFDELREILGEVPLLFTIRTRREGGEADLSADQYLKVVSDAIRDEKADLVDVEISHGDDIAFMLISLAHEFGIKTIASSHDFSQTPKKEQIIMTLCKMQELEADIPKMAVMPQRERDVLVLLDATLSMKELHAQTPVITMAMGRNGVVSRLSGEVFGSAVTFGTAGAQSAPGQIDAEELRKILELWPSSDVNEKTEHKIAVLTKYAPLVTYNGKCLSGTPCRRQGVFCVL